MTSGVAIATLLSALCGEAVQGTPTYPVSAERVRLDVLATDRGRPLRGLAAGDFEVRDNGVVQRIELTAAATLPLELVLVFDTSSSVRGAKLDGLRTCGRIVAEALRDRDRMALVTFSHVVELRAPMTGNREQVLGALDGLQAGGSTALFDAVVAALALPSGRSARPVMVLLSDGRDTASWLAESDVITAARMSEVPVYAVSTWPIGETPASLSGPQTWASVAARSDDELLRRISRETGGRVFRADSASGLEKHLAAVMDEVGERYLVGYTLEGVEKSGWHKVDVRLRHGRGDVLARPGYSFPTPHGGRP
jgi:VWFA-related protein